MANRGRATFAKRQREIARQERAREKAKSRQERDASKTKVDRTTGDPDIAGIVPGPQERTYDLPEDFAEESPSSEESET